MIFSPLQMRLVMDTFRIEDLMYEYAWSQYETDDPRISGLPDATPFNRKEGREILYVIGSLTDHVAWGVEGFGNRVEKMIHDRLPDEVRTQEEVIRWIQDNWKNNSA